MFTKPRQYVVAFAGLAVISGVAIWLGMLAMKGNMGPREDSGGASSAAGKPDEVAIPRPPDSSEPGTRKHDDDLSMPSTLFPPEEPSFAALRRDMVELQIRARDVRDEGVLKALGRVPRHLFVPESVRKYSYDDGPQPIGHGQTISQPYIVGFMTELARPTTSSKALDVGTGSGYQAAILAELCKEVYSIEILEPLAVQARQLLTKLGYANITVRCGDGYRGWPEKAPFDLIIVAAAPDHIPQPLIDQLAKGGRLVIPVGAYYQSQSLMVIERELDGTVRESNELPVSFVPMTGEAQTKRRE